MSEKHLMIAVNWFGPYKTIEEARKDARDGFEDGLYMVIGKLKYQRKEQIQYVGISKKLSNRVSNSHPALCEIKTGLKIWLGEISTAEPGGKRLKATKTTLDHAEWLHARFLVLPLNDKKTKSLPSRSVTVLNRWYKTDWQTPYENRPHTDWANLIDYPHNDLTARAVWFGKKGQRKFYSPKYEQ